MSTITPIAPAPPTPSRESLAGDHVDLKHPVPESTHDGDDAGRIEEESVAAPEADPEAEAEGATETNTDAQQVDTEQPSETTMTEHFYKYKVQMSCGGCSGAIERVLTRARDTGAGVTSFIVSLPDQSVEVRGPIEFDILTEKIAKTGKKILDKEEVIETPSPVEEPVVAEIEPIEPIAQPVAVA